jgi:sulfate transport system ATP-binding protein
VRPHELSISTDPASGGVHAIVERILSIGAFTRVELIGLDASGNRNDHNYEVEILRSELAGLGIRQDQEVFLVPRNLRVFEEPDFSI